LNDSRKARAERTREKIVRASLALFRKQGVTATTLRDIASAAGVSLGAAYYYFASKEAIVLFYYERLVVEHERRAQEIFARTADPTERVRGVFHAKLDLLRRDRKLLGALVANVGDPASTLSVFARQTAHIRRRAQGVLREALSVPGLPEDLRQQGALGLWTLLLAILLYFIHDSSKDQVNTRRLVDGAIELLMGLAPFLALPEAEPARRRLSELLSEAGLQDSAADALCVSEPGEPMM